MEQKKKQPRKTEKTSQAVASKAARLLKTEWRREIRNAQRLRSRIQLLGVKLNQFLEEFDDISASLEGSLESLESRLSLIASVAGSALTQKED